MFQPDANRELQKRIENSVDIMSPLLRAFSNSYRYQILIHLLDSPKTFSDLANQYQLGRTALANHLSLLLDVDLVEKIKKGTYTLSQKGLNLLQVFASVYDNLKLQDIWLKNSMHNQFLHGNYAGQKVNRKLLIQEALFQPTWLSYVGCFTGVLQSFGINIDLAQVAGYSGYCFFLNVAQGTLSPSGPTAFTSEILSTFNTRLEALGCEISTINMNVPFPQESKVTPADRKVADQLFQQIKGEIDSHRSVILWGTSLPEYGIVNGYEGNSYLCSTYRWMTGIKETPIRYDALVAPGVLHAFFIKKNSSLIGHSVQKSQLKESNMDKISIIRAIQLLSGESAMSGYISGISSYEEWAKVLETEEIGPVSYHGQSYTVECLYESKTLATKFLKFLEKRYEKKPQGKWLQLAIEEVTEIKDIAGKLQKIFPFGMSGEINSRMISKGASLLRTLPPYENELINLLQNAVNDWN